MAWYRGRYVQRLEEENKRLLDENRRLLNIMLPRLGYNPLDEPAPKDTSKKPRRKLTWLQWGAKRAAEIAKTPREILIRDPQTIPRPDRPAAQEQASGDAVQPA